MPVIAKAIKPKQLDIPAMFHALDDAAYQVMLEMKDDFEKTVLTWQHKPKFDVHFELGPNRILFSVLTDDEIYGYVDRGTDRHWIEPINAKALKFKPDYKVHSVPNVIGSYAGGASGPFAYSKGHWVKGIEPRNFDRIIYDKWKPEFKKRMQAAMKTAAKASGHEI